MADDTIKLDVDFSGDDNENGTSVIHFSFSDQDICKIAYDQIPRFIERGKKHIDKSDKCDVHKILFKAVCDLWDKREVEPTAALVALALYKLGSLHMDHMDTLAAGILGQLDAMSLGEGMGDDKEDISEDN